MRSMTTKRPLPRPVVKWVGGKRQLLPALLNRIPANFSRYIEPFFGGGALFFSLRRNGFLARPGSSILNDANADLMNMYDVIKFRAEDLLGHLRIFPFENYEIEYYMARTEYNCLRGSNPETSVARASLFLYLNHYGYNGLWRVNADGVYNVPYGRYQTGHAFWSEDSILAASVALHPSVLHCGDFSEFTPMIAQGDFLYLDPPYQPISKTSNFVGYTQQSFSRDDQDRVFSFFSEADRRGARVMLSNSDTPEIREMYESAGFIVETVSARRSVNSKSDGRAGVSEIIVRNYSLPHEPQSLKESQKLGYIYM